MITLQEYRADEGALHHAYFLEVAKAAGLNIGPELLKACRQTLRNDGRAHFNDTPLKAWDDLGLTYQSSLHRALSLRGESWSLSVGACAGKALARHLLEAEGFEIWWATDTIKWEETTPEHFGEMLGAVPPAAMEGSGFLVGEEADHVETGSNYGHPEARFSAYLQAGGKYYKSNRPLSRYQFRCQVRHSKAVEALRSGPESVQS